MKKECIICGRTKEVKDNDIQCCCNYSMWIKEDLDLLRQAGWSRK